MRRTHRLPARLIRWTSLSVCLALVLSCFVVAPLAKFNHNSTVLPPGQSSSQNVNVKKVEPAPPVAGPPAANLPNLDEVRQRLQEAPSAPIPILSTMRSRHKALESRRGRRVGDPLPPPVSVATPSPLVTPTPSPLVTPTPPIIGQAGSKLFARGSNNLLAFNFGDSKAPFRNPSFQFLNQLRPFAGLPFVPAESANTTFDFFVPLMPQSGSSKIAFASNRDGFMQIYVMNGDGSGQARLTYSGVNDDYPRWSPNGAKILFQSDRDNLSTGYMDIYVMNADGSGVSRLTSDANDDSMATWSPDGTKIVFQSIRNGVNYQVYSMNADGSNQVNLTNTSFSEGEPSWSPDGTKIAFASDRDRPGFDSVYVMNSDGSNQHRITFSNGAIEDTQPVWSRDGSKIGFVSTRDSVLETWQETDDYGNVITKSKLHINKEVYVMNADGSGQTRLTNNLTNDDFPSWSPDGSKIVFRSDRDRDCCDPSAQIWTMNADGTNQVNLSNSGNGDYIASWASGSSNQPPVANPGGSYSGTVGQNAVFNGGGSFDPDGSIVSYSWNFGDSGTGSGVGPTHAYSATGTYTVTLTVTDNLGAQGSASTTISISSYSSDQYLQNFHQWALLRQPNGDEASYWTDFFRAAYAHQQGSMLLALREMGRTVFESSEYAARGRSDRLYVYDLYKAYLMREPDQQGWDNWTAAAAVPLYGRDQVRRGFDESTEFLNLVATLTTSGTASNAVSSLATARVDPFNQPGSGLKGRDAEWSVPLLSLPGRAGLDLGLSLSYSSMVWTRSGPYVYFDEDDGFPSPGFRLGFPTIQEKFFDAQAGVNVYLLETAGNRVELRQIGSTNVYEAGDSSYLQLIDSGSLAVRTTDGTKLSYAWFDHEYRCIEIKDRNGNYLTVNYDWRGDITNLTDTLGRVITFNYDGNANPISITQNGRTQPWITFGWGNPSMHPAFSGVTGTYDGEVIPVITMVGFADSTYYKFAYNGSGQVTRVTHYASDSNPATDNHELAHTVFNYGAVDDATRLLNTHVSAENWTGLNYVPSEVVTQYGIEGDAHTLGVVGDPNGTVYKEFYGTGWQRGLTVQSQVWSGGSQQKVTTTQWTQDNINANYQTNPRVTETNVIDSAGNHSRTKIAYNTFTLPSGPSCSLPADVDEYEANATAVARRTHTDYNLDANYLNARLIGLPQAKFLYEGTTTLRAKSTYVYDWGGEYLQNLPAAATQHDGAYTTDYVVGRGNLVDMLRWDVTDPNNSAKALESKMGYDIDGSVVFARDALNHQNSISYSDSFSDNNNRHTFAYPTTATDADGNRSYLQYNFDFGAKTLAQGPPPGNQTQGAIQTLAYDSVARLQQVTTTNSGAYTRYAYGPNYVQSYSTVNTVADEAYAIQVFDGAGRVIGAVSNHPGSTGLYRLVNTIYDVMGRAVKQSNPTEVNNSWTPVGDDAAGIFYTSQTYDWKGRPLFTTNTDGTQKYASYTACGCAGSEVTTLTDEVGRQQKVYSDVLARTAKTEALQTVNNITSVYSTTSNTYNARDQVMQVRQYQGTDQSSVYQDTTMSYDGYGHMLTKHMPEQQVDPNNSSSTDHTTWAYNLDDTIQSVTDARGASATYGYVENNRRLVTSISYNPPSGVNPTANVTYGYDAVGNRTSMTDGLGSKSYNYNQLSQLTSETRTITNVGTFTISYDYNLAGELKKVSDPNNVTINYGFDSIGRLNSVTGSDNLFAGTLTYASNFQYRAFDAVKGLTYGNSKTLSVGYDNRLQASSFEVPGILKRSYQRNNDSSLQFSQDQLIVNSKFDRSYNYDHLGRISTALSGAEARGQGPTDDRPYHEAFGYDAMDHMTSRDLRHWDRPDSGGTQTYVNNRNPSWSYDADGRLTSGSTGSYIYDAAGTISSFGDSDPNMTDQLFDGDGQRLKSVQRRYDDQTNQWATDSVTYYLNSTMLGGQVVTELNGQGTKQRTYVYAGQTVLAWQSVAINGTQSVAWEHRDASGASFRMTDASGQGTGQPAELDPVGADAGLFKPLVWNPPDSTGKLITFRGFEDMDMAGGGCTLDRVPIPCGIFNDLMGAGAIEVEQLLRAPQKSPPKEPTRGQPFVPAANGASPSSIAWGWETQRTEISSLGLGLFGADIQVGWSFRNEEGSPVWERVLFSSGQQETFPGAYGRINFLPAGGSYGQSKQQTILDTMVSLAESENCAKAFKDAGLASIKDLIQGVIVIGPASLLSDPNDAAGIGITEAARARDAGSYGSTAIQAVTIRDHPGYKPDTTNGRPHIFLNASAFGGGALSLREVLTHELIHVAGVDAKDPGILGTLLGRDDLSYYKNYDSIMAACK